MPVALSDYPKPPVPSPANVQPGGRAHLWIILYRGAVTFFFVRLLLACVTPKQPRK